MRTSWEKLAQYVGTSCVHGIYNELQNKVAVVLPEPEYDPEILTRHGASSPVFPCYTPPPPRSRPPPLVAVPISVPVPVLPLFSLRTVHLGMYPVVPFKPGQVAMFLKVTVVASHGTIDGPVQKELSIRQAGAAGCCVVREFQLVAAGSDTDTMRFGLVGLDAGNKS